MRKSDGTVGKRVDNSLVSTQNECLNLGRIS